MQLLDMQSMQLPCTDQTYQHNVLALLKIKLYWFYLKFYYHAIFLLTHNLYENITSKRTIIIYHSYITKAKFYSTKPN